MNEGASREGLIENISSIQNYILVIGGVRMSKKNGIRDFLGHMLQCNNASTSSNIVCAYYNA